jgi:TRAP transporter TAXI family solute receptor
MEDKNMALRIGTSEHGGTFFTQGSALSELFNRGRPENDRCVVQTSDASIHNANLLDRGELEFGFMASNWIGRAKDARPPFTRAISLRMVAPANAGPMFFVKLASSPIQTVADFPGKRIAVGVKGSGMEQHVHTIFDVLGISFDSFTPVYLSFDEGANRLIAGDIDAQFQPPIPNRVMTDLSQRADVRVVPYATGQLVGTSHIVILGMQALGGAAGNMITVHNVVAASATVGLVGREGLLIRRTIVPMTYYVVFAGLLGLLFAYVIFPNVF